MPANLSNAEQQKVIDQAIQDRQTGDITHYEGDGVVDFLLKPVDKACGLDSSKDIAEAKQHLYNDLRLRHG